MILSQWDFSFIFEVIMTNYQVIMLWAWTFHWRPMYCGQFLTTSWHLFYNVVMNFFFNWPYDQNARLTELVELSTLINFANINKLSKRSQKKLSRVNQEFCGVTTVQWFSLWFFISLFYHCSLRTVGSADKLTPSSGASSSTGTL